MALGGVLIMMALTIMLASCALPGTAATTSSSEPSSVAPLPQHSALVQSGKSTQGIGQTWMYAVPNTDATKVEKFYHSSLPQQGWSGYHAEFQTIGGSQSVTITAEQSMQFLKITAGAGSIGTVTSPPSGVILTLDVEPMGV